MQRFAFRQGGGGVKGNDVLWAEELTPAGCPLAGRCPLSAAARWGEGGRIWGAFTHLGHSSAGRVRSLKIAA